MQPQVHYDEQMRAVEYPPKPLGSLARGALKPGARYSLDFLSLVPLTSACYTAGGRAFSGTKERALAKYAMNPLPT
jgi:hypothetical protein